MPERRKTRTDRMAGKRGRVSSRTVDDTDEDFEDYDDEDYDDEDFEDDDDNRARVKKREPRKRSSRTMTVTDAARAGLRQIVDMTGKEPSGVVFVEPRDDGWLIEIEMLEDRRVPSTSDVMGLYEVLVDADGNLASYRRTRRYARGRGDDGGAV